MSYSVNELFGLITEMSSEQAVDICADDEINFVLMCSGDGAKNLNSQEFVDSVSGLSDADKNTLQQAVWGANTKIGWLMHPIT